MKKTALIAFLLCLVMVAAQAAPTREPSPAALENMELAAQVQPLADLAAAIAFSYDVPALPRDGVPENRLVQSALYLALSRHLLVVQANEGKVSLSVQDAESAVRLFFARPDISFARDALIPELSFTDQGPVFDVSRVDDYVGTHIVDLDVNEERLSVQADVYRLSGISGSAVEAPEDSLQWLGYLEIILKPKVDSLYGFGLDSFAVKERYQPASMAQFMLKDRFELQYPDIFLETPKAEGDLLSLASADGAARLSVKEVPGALETLVEGWKDPAAVVEAGRAVSSSPGLFRVAYSDGAGEGEGCLVLEMSYPTTRLMEFTLYQTFLNNSFVVYSHSMG